MSAYHSIPAPALTWLRVGVFLVYRSTGLEDSTWDKKVLHFRGKHPTSAFTLFSMLGKLCLPWPWTNCAEKHAGTVFRSTAQHWHLLVSSP